MRLSAFALLLLASPVSVRPVRAEPTTCAVTLTGAPREIHEIVDPWLRAEPRCGAALEVTIAAADGGYLLDARDARGGRRVRFAPDAQIAGALIESWAADGSIELSALGGDLPTLTASQVVVPPAATTRSAEPHDLDRRVLLGAVVGVEQQGMRGEIDLVVLRHRVSLGVAAAGSTGNHGGGLERDLAAGGYVGLGFTAARWQLRAQLAAGAQLTELHTYDVMDQNLFRFTLTTLVFATDASLTVSREVAPGWAATGGALIHALPGASWRLARVAPMAVLGVSCRL